MSAYIKCDDTSDCPRTFPADASAEALAAGWYIPGDEHGDMCPEHALAPSSCYVCGGDNMDELRCPDAKYECVYCCEPGGHDGEYPEENREEDHAGNL